MDHQRWKRVHDIFLEICDLPPAERELALDRECDEDSALRNEVVSILESSENAPDFFEGRIAGDDPPIDAAPLRGRRIGPYRIVQEIASGGMGTVYLAERDDRQFEKKVALKAIRWGCEDKESIDRFRSERQTLALLSHPNIAQLFDGGVTDEGLPYLVMEYVDGRQVDVYCAEESYSVRQKLGLFRTICRAVQHAHRNLVVHRDLKPANILVRDDGVPKLLDFGIAKILQPENAAAEANATLTGRQRITPDYASPEQIRGEPVTTSTDVYSLGVILFELLTGHKPYRIRTRTASEVERAILQTEPPLPSVIVRRENGPRELRRLSSRLRGDLDNIVMMALRKEPQRRYASVEELAGDIDNYLARRPVRARRDTLAYRSCKFVRRHVAVVAISIFMFLSIGAGTVVLAHNGRIAARERDKAEAMVRFLDHTLSSVDPSRKGSEVTVREALDEAAKRLDGELATQPAVRAALHATIGRAYTGLGLYDRAASHLRAALEDRRSALGDSHSEVIQLSNMLSCALYELAALQEAEVLLRMVLDRCTSRFGQRHVLTAQTQNNLGAVLSAAGALEEAERLLRAALESRRALLEKDHPDIAETLNNLAGILRRKGEVTEATRLLQETLEMRRRQLGENHPLSIQSVTNLAVLEHMTADLEQSEMHYREALERSRRVLGDDHPDLSHTLRNLAMLLFERGNFTEAERLLADAIAIRKARFPAVDRLLLELEMARGYCLLRLGRLKEAEAELLGVHDLATGISELRSLARETAQVLELLCRISGREADEGKWAAEGKALDDGEGQAR